jgi:hypothetical protein
MSDIPQMTTVNATPNSTQMRILVASILGAGLASG